MEGGREEGKLSGTENKRNQGRDENIMFVSPLLLLFYFSYELIMLKLPLINYKINRSSWLNSTVTINPLMQATLRVCGEHDKIAANKC